MRIDEAVEIGSRMSQAGNKDLTIAEVSEAIALLAEHYYATRKGISMSGVGGAPDWYGYETALWKLSEAIRGFLKGRRDIKGNNELLDKISVIAEEKRFGKGRQNFVLIIGDFGGKEYSNGLKSLLNDPEVYGYAINALTKLKVTDCSNEIEKVLQETKTGWIKTAAKNYLKKAKGAGVNKTESNG